jgi:hypothetical protein
MLAIRNTLISDDVVSESFICNIEACKAACCVEGDAGAPLSEEETMILEKEFSKIKTFLSPEGVAEIEKKGTWVLDVEGEKGTPTLETKECAYALKGENGILNCGIEKAWEAGATSFRKPISCHLYPIRIKEYKDFVAVNYHRWNICQPACFLGKKEGVKVYQFLKEALVRRFGYAWYEELCALADYQNQKKN